MSFFPLIPKTRHFVKRQSRRRPTVQTFLGKATLHPGLCSAIRLRERKRARQEEKRELRHVRHERDFWRRSERIRRLRRKQNPNASTFRIVQHRPRLLPAPAYPTGIPISASSIPVLPAINSEQRLSY